MQSRSGVRKKKRDGEQEWSKERNEKWRAGWSKEGKGDMESRSGVRKEKETWRAGVE